MDYLELLIQTLRWVPSGDAQGPWPGGAKGARFLITSTSEIYGDPLAHPQTESYWGNVNTIGPRGCYDESKRFAEALVMAYHREHQVATRIVAGSSTPMVPGCGFAMVGGSGVYRTGAGDQPITIFGDGTQTRSFAIV